MVTFDGLHYDFQQVGEFVLAKSTALGDSFEVQIRTQPYGVNSVVSVTVAMAVQVGADRVTFDATRADILWVNGKPVTLAAGASDPLPGGTVLALTANSYQVTEDTGEVVRVGNYDGVLSDWVQVAGSYSGDGHVEGLLGNADGNPGNDIALPVGTVLSQPLSQQDLYNSFGNSWRLSDPGLSTGFPSLLDYGTGQSTATFTDISDPASVITLADLPASVVANATAAVTAAGLDPNSVHGQDAVLDYALTNNPSFIAADATLQQVEASAPTPLVVSPGTTTAPLSGGVVSPATALTELATGSTPVVFQVYTTQPVTADTVLDWSVISPGSGFLTAADFGGTLPSGTATIDTGNSSGGITIELPAGAVGGDVSDTLRVQISDTGGTPLLGTTADVQITNSSPVAGTPALPQFVELSGPDALVQTGNDYTLDLGRLVIGSADPVIDLAVANQATAGANLLSGSFTLAGDGALTVSGAGTFEGIAGGAFQAGIGVTLDTAAVGQYSETITLSPTDSNASGGGGVLAAQTLTITADVTMPCFAIGTLIMTVHAEVPVELLREGNLIVTASGKLKKVRWIGLRHIDCLRHAKPRDVWPVRVLAGAFGGGLPKRELWLSPDHAVFVGGVLIPVRYLINGRTIVQKRVAEVTYYHVELATHDVILAEGLPCESYLDTGNRSDFENGNTTIELHPTFARGVWAVLPAVPSWCWKASGLSRRSAGCWGHAAALGHAITNEPALTFRDRRRSPVLPADIDGRAPGAFAFRRPRAACAQSATWVPAHTRADESDTRTLGVAIGNLRFDGAAIPLDDARLSSGWHAAEPEWAWTDGDAGWRWPACEPSRSISPSPAAIGPRRHAVAVARPNVITVRKPRIAASPIRCPGRIGFNTPPPGLNTY